MTSTLVMLLSGPLQSWGDSSRYSQRTTRSMPTKSGVLGLIAAAQGRPRTAPVDDLAELKFAVRVDQPGTLLRDYQTAQKWQTTGSTHLVERYYLADAAFCAAVESPDDAIVDAIAESLMNPRFPLFMGRRSCPAPVRLVQGVHRTDLVSALHAVGWHANLAHRQTRAQTVNLPIFRDVNPGERGTPQQDVPISFDQEHRQYGWREVIEDPNSVVVDNPDGYQDDPFFDVVRTA